MNPIISVIVPVYNAESTIERCISSIQKQIYQQLEILIVVDGAEDCSLDICQSIAKQDHRIKVFAIENHGVSYARNLALSYAKGEYVVFVDSDDWIEPKMYQSMVNCATMHCADVVIQPLIFDRKNSYISNRSTGEVIVMNGYDAMIEMLKGRMFAGHLCNKMIRRSCITATLCEVNIHIYEDLYAMWNILPWCKKVVFQKEYCYHYCIMPNSSIHQIHNLYNSSVDIVVDRIYRNAEVNFPKSLPYVKRMVIQIYRNQLHRAFRGRKVYDERFEKEYIKFQKLMDKYFTQDVWHIMSPSERYSICIEKSGKLFFIIYWYVHWQLSTLKHFLESVLYSCNIL